ncbi:MAG: hypothetical protein K9G06_04325 [Chitinophagaceae bacterium]|nr:hypothetical protein [Chitinophagaceae bacterium]
MKKSSFFKFCFIVSLLCVLHTDISAQGGKLLLLKDRGVVLRSFTEGDYINFEFSNAQWLTGYIDWIRNDSIQINQFALQGSVTMYGTYGQDTLKLGKLVLHINEIRAFAKDRGRFRSVFTNGVFLKAGGIGYLSVNIINSAINGDNILESKNIPRLAGGFVAWLAGALVKKSNPDYRPIGKRFSVEIL